ncbi:TPA: sugar transferase [Klebsiella pneumoniae]|nr:sugar transferase [Klebsiella pneumoniae]
MTLIVRNIIVSLSLAISDFLAFVASLYIAIGLLCITSDDYVQIVSTGQVEGWTILHWLLGFCCVGWYSMRLRHYFYRKTFWFELKEMLRTLIIFAVIEIAVMAFATWSFYRTLWFLTWFLILIFVPLARMGAKRILDILGIWQRDTWIIGSSENAKEAYKAITSERNLGLVVVGFVETPGGVCAGEKIDGIPVVNNNIEWLRTKNTKTQFIVAVESHQSEIRNTWLRNFMIKGYRFVSVIPTLRGMPLDSTDMSFIFSHEVMIFRVQQNLAKLSERIGKGGKSFKCLKFRSMVINSKEVLDELLASDAEAKREWDATFKLKNDPRVTKIGGFLRRTSLDELPQLFNVLKGEMSLVGPRPIITAELERYNEEVDYYLLSKPGMTGLWQVSGRSDVDYETRVYLDAWYVKNWSMWNDIAILFKTVGVVLKKDGAY